MDKRPRALSRREAGPPTQSVIERDMPVPRHRDHSRAEVQEAEEAPAVAIPDDAGVAPRGDHPLSPRGEQEWEKRKTAERCIAHSRRPSAALQAAPRGDDIRPAGRYLQQPYAALRPERVQDPDV